MTGSLLTQGSGLGGLDWSIVKARIESALQSLTDVRIIVYEPFEHAQVYKLKTNLKAPNMTPGRAAFRTYVSLSEWFA